MTPQPFKDRARKEFRSFVEGRRLRRSVAREKILETFLGIERHVTAEDLWTEVRRRDPSVGSATVYRALKLLCESGIAQEVRISREKTVFEHKTGHAHHDHLLCEACGQLIEAADARIEKLQERLAAEHGFLPSSHSLVIRGLCADCRPKKRKR